MFIGRWPNLQQHVNIKKETFQMLKGFLFYEKLSYVDFGQWPMIISQ